MMRFLVQVFKCEASNLSEVVFQTIVNKGDMANSKSSSWSVTASHLKPIGIIAIGIAILAVAAPHLSSLSAHLHPVPISAFFKSNNQSTPTTPPTDQPKAEQPLPVEFTCDSQHPYKTEIVSLDPLLIYIRNFLSPAETAALLTAGDSAFKPSEVYKGGRKQGTADRTSSSAGLPRDDPAVTCVLGRAAQFMGTMLDPARDDIGPPQLVRYVAGQRFNSHHDWYASPRGARAEDHWRGGSWNRITSFFAILEDGCEGGETWFPYVNVRDDGVNGPGNREQEEEGDAGLKKGGNLAAKEWRRHEDGGVAFAPVTGNALFWVNLFPNGTGDPRTVHSGLPVESGLKTAMNIWPRKYYD